MDDVVAEILQELKDQLAEMSSEERREVFGLLQDDYCMKCGDQTPCYCDEGYDE